MLQDVRANNQVILTQGFTFLSIEIDAAKGSVGNLRKQPLLFVSEGNLASLFHEGRPENAVATTEIQHTRLWSKRYAPLIDPPDGILSLKRVNCWALPLFEVLGQEPVNNNAGLIVRKMGFCSKTLPRQARVDFHAGIP